MHKSQKQHKRTRTFPLSQPSTSPKKQPLPPVLKGCQCSVCNSQQSLGAFTLGKGPVQLTKYCHNSVLSLIFRKYFQKWTADIIGRPCSSSWGSIRNC